MLFCVVFLFPLCKERHVSLGLLFYYEKNNNNLPIINFCFHNCYFHKDESDLTNINIVTNNKEHY